MILIEQYQDKIKSSFRGFNRATLIPEIIMSLNELEDFWPLIVRQLYYRLVSKPVIENNEGCYKKVSRVVTKLRRMDIVPWEIIEDRTRSISEKRGWDSTIEYSRAILKTFDRYDPDFWEQSVIAYRYPWFTIRHCIMPLLYFHFRGNEQV